MILKNPSKMAREVEVCLKKRKQTTPSTNIPLLSLRKSEKELEKMIRVGYFSATHKFAANQIGMII